MNQSIGVALIVKNVEQTIKQCIDSFAEDVDQIIVVGAGESTDKTPEILSELQEQYKHLELYDFEWIDDFSAARNFSFSKLTTDFLLWVDGDDVVYQAENLKRLANEAQPNVGAIWFPYHYAIDEFGSPTTIYERERLLRASCGWVWKSRLHETVSPLSPCQHVRTDEVIILHNHKAGADRGERNFRILNLMMQEDPNDKRVWLYMGHQHFACQNWMDSAQWYLKFGSDKGAIPIERYQALCYCSKAMREMKDTQAIEVALMALEIYPQYKDAYLELAHCYLVFGDIDKAIHYAMMSDVKELIQEPPHIIFINPLEYTFNKYALLSECYLKKGDFQTSLHYLNLAREIRPTQEIESNVKFISDMIVRNRVAESIKVLAVQLLNNKEIIKLTHLLHATPYWFRDLPDFEQLKEAIGFYSKEIKDDPELVEVDGGAVVNIANCINPVKVLEELDKKYDKITVISPFPHASQKQINVYSQSDMESLVVSAPNRHLLNLRREPSRIVCEYDHTVCQGLSVRLYVGQGLEYWNPKTIQEIGCGGSETAAARISAEMAKQGHVPILYAMDNQVWDGVVYREHSRFNPSTLMPHDLFISSRVPEILNNDIAAKQKWLWMHDIHCFNRLTPDIAERIDAIVCLSHWHADFLRRVYPFLSECEVIDMDDQGKTFEDAWTPATFYKDEKINRLPKIAIIGNGLDTERFIDLKADKIPNRFIWCSSPDRGLEELLIMWGGIKKHLPDATLKIFYGWEYFDTTLYIPEQREFKERIKKLIKQDSVEWCGRVGQDRLAGELAKASFMLYPPHPFRETYGIAFLEAQAAGVVCIYRQNGALGETIGKRGVSLPMDMNHDNIIQKTVETAQSDLNGIIKLGKEFALNRTWKAQCDKMLGLYGRIEKCKR